MASVEQREATHPAGLTSLEIFDKFKSLEDDKDSDEESFHLPLLESEEDSPNKDSVPTSHQNGETEDEILNKFDCAVTPDVVDPKVEDSILDDELEDGNEAVNTAKEEKEIEQVVDKNGIDGVSETNGDIPKPEENAVEKEELPVKNSEEKNDNESDNINKKEDAPMEVEEKVPEETTEPTKTADILEDKTKNDQNEKETVNVEMKEDEAMKVDEEIVEKCDEKEENTIEVPKTGEEDKTESEVVTESEKESVKESEKESVKESENESVKESENESVKESEKESVKESEDVQPMEVEENENVELKAADKVAENEFAKSDVVSEDAKEISTDNSTLPKDETSKDVTDQTIGASVESKPTAAAETANVEAKDNVEPELKTATDEKLNESGNSENLERDDLLDISVICDVDEDNAKAVEENANDGQTSEKSDKDDQDYNPENDLDDSENDQDETACSSDKDDAMESDDCVGNTNSNLQFDESSSTNDNVTISSTNNKIISDSIDSSDSVSNKEDVEMVDVLPKVIAGLVSTDSQIEPVPKSQTEQAKTDNESEAILASPEESVEYLDLDKHMAEQKKAQAVTTSQSGKRSLPLEESQDGAAIKKIRLTELIKDDKKLDGKTKTLTSFESFMRNKVFNKKLTKSDLEQFCVQKICEAIMHKSEVGDLQQTVKKQEQIIETLRKDLQQLTKQARDLDIVNKKLINELKGQNGRQKPLVPLKITRSVGLQVKLSLGTEPSRKRAPITPNRPNAAPAASPSPANNRARITSVNSNNSVVRQVVPNATAARKQQSTATTPILSQALQTTNSTIRQPNTPVSAPKRPPISHSKVVERPKPSNPGVIDLTDEDDRAAKPAGGTPVKMVTKQLLTTQKLVPAKQMTKSPGNQAKVIGINQIKAGQVVNKGTPTRTVTTLPQGVRLTPTGAVKNGIAIPANVVTSSTGGPQLMYLVQPTSSTVTSTAGGGQKTVLLNFQPSNGILTSALNGSAVSVIPTKTNVQIKAQGPRKHPAPLPLPPPVQLLSNLKPLLPKPHLSIRKTDTGIILQWRMPYNLDSYECIASYQLFAYQETNAPPSTDMWRKVGDVKALALPMACTLTQFADKNKYYFAVRSVDVHKRIGAFSDPEEISL